MTRIRRFGIATLLTVAALTMAGCGGSSNSAAPAAGPTTGSAAAAQQPTATAGKAGSASAPSSVTSKTAGAPITVADPSAANSVSPSTSSSSPSVAVSSGDTTMSGASRSSSAPPSTTKPAPLPPKAATITASPAFGTAKLNPLDPMKLTVTGGKIADLVVYAEDQSKITGALSADRTTWTSNQKLRYGGNYHAVGTATGEKGSAPTKIDGTWTTFDPPTQTTSISPGDGAVVGVAAPIIIRFGACVADHAAVEKHVTVTTTPKVALRGIWIQHDGDKCRSLDLRPADFWPENTKVHVAVDLLGVQVSDGLWGARSPATSDFTIGRNRVTYADPKSKMLTVKEDGKIVAQYPTSMGSGDDIGDPHRVTRSGIHVVTDKEAIAKMSNPRYKYKDLPEPWAVRISNNGEFIHENAATVDVQGKQNVSHGCLNLSAVNAKAYFDKAIYGDPVVITGTSQKLGPTDGDIFDWTVPFDQWHALKTGS